MCSVCAGWGPTRGASCGPAQPLLPPRGGGLLAAGGAVAWASRVAATLGGPPRHCALVHAFQPVAHAGGPRGRLGEPVEAASGGRWCSEPRSGVLGTGASQAHPIPSLPVGPQLRAAEQGGEPWCSSARACMGPLTAQLINYGHECHCLVMGARGPPLGQAWPPQGRQLRSHEAQKKGLLGADGGGRLGTRQKPESKGEERPGIGEARPQCRPGDGDPGVGEARPQCRLECRLRGDSLSTHTRGPHSRGSIFPLLEFIQSVQALRGVTPGGA